MTKKDINYYSNMFNLAIIEKVDNKYKLIDKYGYFYLLSAENLKCTAGRDGNPAVFFNLNPYTRDNIINYIRINNIDIKLITEDFLNVNAKTKLLFSCPLHGDFQKSWNEIKNRQCCPICGRETASKNRRNNIEDVKKKFLEKDYILLADKYISNQQPMDYICLKHEEKGVQKISWGNFIMGQECLYCTKERLLSQLTKPINVFNQEVKDLYGGKFILLDNYVNSHTKIKMYCNDCQSEFYQKPGHLLSGHMGCNCKSKSLGEELIYKYFKENNVYFQQQYRIKECRNKKPLPFDFAVFEDKDKTQLKYLIEFQGKQHYENTGWSSDKEVSLKSFQSQKINDRIKQEYCNKQNIKLITIPYWDIRKLDSLLKSIIF